MGVRSLPSDRGVAVTRKLISAGALQTHHTGGAIVAPPAHRTRSPQSTDPRTRRDLHDALPSQCDRFLICTGARKDTLSPTQISAPMGMSVYVPV